MTTYGQTEATLGNRHPILTTKWQQSFNSKILVTFLFIWHSQCITVSNLVPLESSSHVFWQQQTVCWHRTQVRHLTWNDVPVVPCSPSMTRLVCGNPSYSMNCNCDTLPAVSHIILSTTASANVNQTSLQLYTTTRRPPCCHLATSTKQHRRMNDAITWKHDTSHKTVRT